MAESLAAPVVQIRAAVSPKVVSDGFTGVQEKYQPTFVAPDAEILIVDDNEMNLLIAKKLLAATRIKIDTAASGVICLEKIARKHYDLIFMDQLMPNLSGTQTLAMARSMRENLSRDTPVDMELMELMLLTYLPLEKIHSE